MVSRTWQSLRVNNFLLEKKKYLICLHKLVPLTQKPTEPKKNSIPDASEICGETGMTFSEMRALGLNNSNMKPSDDSPKKKTLKDHMPYMQKRGERSKGKNAGPNISTRKVDIGDQEALAAIASLESAEKFLPKNFQNIPSLPGKTGSPATNCRENTPVANLNEASFAPPQPIPHSVSNTGNLSSSIVVPSRPQVNKSVYKMSYEEQEMAVAAVAIFDKAIGNTSGILPAPVGGYQYVTPSSISELNTYETGINKEAAAYATQTFQQPSHSQSNQTYNQYSSNELVSASSTQFSSILNSTSNDSYQIQNQTQYIPNPMEMKTSTSHVPQIPMLSPTEYSNLNSQYNSTYLSQNLNTAMPNQQQKTHNYQQFQTQQSFEHPKLQQNQQHVLPHSQQHQSHLPSSLPELPQQQIIASHQQGQPLQTQISVNQSYSHHHQNVSGVIPQQRSAQFQSPHRTETTSSSEFNPQAQQNIQYHSQNLPTITLPMNFPGNISQQLPIQSSQPSYNQTDPSKQQTTTAATQISVTMTSVQNVLTSYSQQIPVSYSQSSVQSNYGNVQSIATLPPSQQNIAPVLTTQSSARSVTSSSASHSQSQATNSALHNNPKEEQLQDYSNLEFGSISKQLAEEFGGGLNINKPMYDYNQSYDQQYYTQSLSNQTCLNQGTNQSSIQPNIAPSPATPMAPVSAQIQSQMSNIQQPSYAPLQQPLEPRSVDKKSFTPIVESLPPRERGASEPKEIPAPTLPTAQTPNFERRLSTASSLDDILSASPTNEQEKILKPYCITEEEREKYFLFWI